MRRTISSAIVGLLVLVASTAYGQTLQSETTWGAAGAEFAGGVAVAPDGSSYFTGTSDSFAFDQFGTPDPRIFLLRFTPTGALDWQRIWNGLTGHGETAVAVAPDGSVYVTGLASAANDGDAILLKFSATGTLLWERTWGGPAQESGDAVAVAQDGSVYIGGRTTSFDNGALFVVKFNSAGSLVWQKVFDNVIGETLTVAPDGSVYAAGTSERPGSGFSQFDLVTVKISSGGALQWARRYQAGEFVDARGGMAAAPNSGSIAIVGDLQAAGSGGVIGNAPLLVNLSAAGDLVFARTWGGNKTGGDGSGVAIAPNGTIYMSGTITGLGPFQEAFVASVLANGKAGMAVTWGGPAFEEGRGVAVTAGGTVVLGAQTTAPPPYTFQTAPRKVSGVNGDLIEDFGALVDVIGVVTTPTDGASTPNGSTTYGGNLEAVLIRFIP